MQSISELPNCQMKSDITQMIFEHLNTKEVVSFAFINRFFRAEWNRRIRSKTIDHLILESISNNGNGCDIFVEEPADTRLLLFSAPKWNILNYERSMCKRSFPTRYIQSITRKLRGKVSKEISILRPFIQMIFTCKYLECLTIDVRDKTINETDILEAIRNVQVESPDASKISGTRPVRRLAISADQLYCIKLFPCSVLKFLWANEFPADIELIRGVDVLIVRSEASVLLCDRLFDVLDCSDFMFQWQLTVDNYGTICGYLARFLKEWQRNSREIKRIRIALLGRELDVFEVVAMSQDVCHLVGQNCQMEPPEFQTNHFFSGFYASKPEGLNDIGVLWDSTTTSLEILCMPCKRD